MIGKSEEPQKYLLYCSRCGAPKSLATGFRLLNVIMALPLFVGLVPLAAVLFLVRVVDLDPDPLFITGWVLGPCLGGGLFFGSQLCVVLMCFFMAETKVGLGFVIPALIIFVIVVNTSLVEIPFVPFLPFMLSYIAGWIYVNVVASRYKKLARQRLADIERGDASTTNSVLEKGVLLAMLEGRPQALWTLNSAFVKEGGDSFLWNLGGLVLMHMKAYPEALQAFERAIAASPDRKSTKRIKKIRGFVQRKLRS